MLSGVMGGVTVLTGLALASTAQAEAGACAALASKIYPAHLMQYPNSGARITEASWVPAQGPAGAYCKVRGEIAPVDPEATRTLFAVNLPEAWNNKAVQFGGGGLNGTLVQATGLLRDDPPGRQPLAKGYVTLGNDGGHPNLQPEQAVFHLNAEAEVNNAYGANKNTHDLARVILSEYYGRAASRFYFYGGSEGGRAALQMAQMFPTYFDGVVSNVPSTYKTLNYIAKNNLWVTTQRGGWMNEAEVRLLARATLESCDGIDGLRDGVISNYRACAGLSKPEALRCPDGIDAGDHCLTDAQIATIRIMRSPYDIGYALKQGVTSLPGLSIGGEAQPGGMIPQVMAEGASPSADDPGSDISGNQFVRYAIMRDPASRGAPDVQRHKDRIIELSMIADASDPNLHPFFASGGRLIMKANGADFQVGPEGVIRYYESVVAAVGPETAAQHIRLYVNPGVNHGGSGVAGDGSAVPGKVDLLDVLDSWVDQGAAPGHLTVTAYEAGQPVATKPLCLYPSYPHYTGTGDPKAATSFTCSPL